MSDQQWTSDDAAMVSMGDGEDVNGKPRLKKLEGRYLYTEVKTIKGRRTHLHRIERQDGTECQLFGSGSVNTRLAKLPSGTLVRFTYRGEKDTGKGNPMKDILVEWPKGTVLKTAPQNDATDDVDY